MRKHCLYRPQSWVFMFLHHGMRLEQKHQRSVRRCAVSRPGQQRARLLFVEAGSTSGKGSVLELSPNIL